MHMKKTALIRIERLRTDADYQRIVAEIEDAIAKSKPIRLIVEAEGGLINERFFQLLDLIRANHSKISAIGPSKFGSAAAFIFLAAGRRLVTRNTLVTLHGIRVFAPLAVLTDHHRRKKHLKTYGDYDNRLRKFLGQRTKLRRGELDEIFSGGGDAVFTADEALATGVADEIK